MTDINVVALKISAVEKYLKLLENFKKYSRQDLENDIILRGATERYLYLACDSAISLGEAVISFKNFRKPSAYSEVFYILGEESMISKELEQKLVEMAKFRNIISHDYGKLDFNIVYKALSMDIGDLKEFELTVKKYLNL